MKNVMKLLVLMYNTLITTLTILLGGVFYIDWRLSIKYRIMIVVVPEKYSMIPPMAVTDFFGGMIYLPVEWKDDEFMPFILLHEKGHCRTWRGIPDQLFAVCKGHGKKTAAYEYAADKYAADAGYKELGIEFLMEIYHQTGDRDLLRRANALRRMK